MLVVAFMIVALVLFVLASIAPAALQPHQGRLLPLGLAFATGAWLLQNVH